VAAVRRPSRLPADLRQRLTAVPVPPHRATGVLVEGFQWVARQERFGGEVHALLQPPADLPHVLDSESWPIRVSYRDQWDVSLAESALAAAEYSFSEEIGTYGFYQPPTADASGLYRIFIDNTGMGGGGYTAPFDFVPDTPWTDCYTYIVVDPSNPEWSIDGVMAHEANHAMQAAMDCMEVTTFWENTAVYIAAAVYPQEWYYAIGTMPYFQSQPWRALDYMARPNSDLYEYGGGLFAIWLADTFSEGDHRPAVNGARLLRSIWEASMQQGSFNEPDYYDAIEQHLQDRGHDVTMGDLLLDFSEARFFVGTEDDGFHIQNADNFSDAEVALVAEHYSTELPLYDVAPPEAKRPASFGTNHIRLDLAPSWGFPVEVHFDGDDETRWAARVVRFGGGVTEAVELPLDESTQDGSVVVEPGSHAHLLLVVTNQGVPTYDPDQRSWPTSDYRYGLQPVIPAPTLRHLVPETVQPGTQNLEVRLVGSGFVSGPEFFLRFEDESLDVMSVDHVTGGEVVFTLTVPGLTAPGPKTIILTNGDGTVVRGEGFLTVETPPAEPTEGDPGCGCHSGGAEAPVGVALGLWLGLLLGLWRRQKERT
jgi:MYXO-CTERM domain-containing protein